MADRLNHLDTFATQSSRTARRFSDSPPPPHFSTLRALGSSSAAAGDLVVCEKMSRKTCRAHLRRMDRKANLVVCIAACLAVLLLAPKAEAQCCPGYNLATACSGVTLTKSRWCIQATVPTGQNAL